MNHSEHRETVFKQIEAVQIALYCSIMRTILNKYDSMSVIKIMLFSFIIKKNMNLQTKVFSASNKNDILLKYLSQITGRYDELISQLNFIVKAIDILVCSGKYSVKQGQLSLTASKSTEHSTSLLDSFTCAAIEDSIHYTDRQFLKEVISIV